MILPQEQTIHFRINSTSVIRPVKQNQFSFSSVEINTTLPTTVKCLVDQIQIQKPTLIVPTDQLPDHSRE